ncbi:MAG: TolC family protein [Pseudomonadota bacterium]
MRQIHWLITGLLFLTGLPLGAQTLAEVFEQAWANHPQAGALSARANEAQAAAETTRGLTPGPGSVSASQLDDRFNSHRGRQEWEAEWSIPLWLPGQRSARESQAEGQGTAVAARRTALRLEVAGELREAWWNLAAARDGHRLAPRRVESARALEDDIQRRYRAGELARTDANLAQTERLTAQTEASESEGALLKAEQAYQALTGTVAPGTLGEEHLDPVLAHHPPALAADHPRLAAALAASRLAHATLRVAEVTRRDAPELALRLVRDRANRDESFDTAVGIKLTLPFSSGSKVRQETAGAQAEAAQADAELATIRRQLELALTRAQRDWVLTGQQQDLARQRRELTADSLALTGKSFALGEADLATLLRSRAAALEAGTLFDRQQVARAAAGSRFLQSLGRLP